MQKGFVKEKKHPIDQLVSLKIYIPAVYRSAVIYMYMEDHDACCYCYGYFFGYNWPELKECKPNIIKLGTYNFILGLILLRITKTNIGWDITLFKVDSL